LRSTPIECAPILVTASMIEEAVAFISDLAERLDPSGSTPVEVSA
jgi:hypothetical protein